MEKDQSHQEQKNVKKYCLFGRKWKQYTIDHDKAQILSNRLENIFIDDNNTDFDGEFYANVFFLFAIRC